MTKEQKAKAYDEALEKARQLCTYPTSKPFISDLQDLFPELKESEDERIRKALIEYFTTSDNNSYYAVCGVATKKILAWLEKQGTPAKLSEEEQNKFAKGVLTSCALSFIDYLDAHKYEGKMCVSNGECEDIENAFHNAMWDRLHRYYCKYIEKQGEQKPADKIEPKFKTGQWIVWQDKYYKVNYNGCGYELIDQNGLSTSLEYGTIDENAHLWDITKDAKDGDVLSDGTTIFIFKDLLSDGSVMSYCDYDTDSGESDAFCPLSVNLMCSKITPTTKEQRDLLFQKMKEAGYEWNSSKKQLQKIVQTPVWSKEDEDRLDIIFERIERGLIVDKDDIDRLKSLKDRVQPKHEWSEEDDENMKEIILFCDTLASGAMYSISGERFKSISETLKSLKERYTWKPSDEQIKALEHFVRSIGESGYASPYENNTKLLYSLLEQLKKLMEG